MPINPNTPQAKDDLYNVSTKFLVVDENTTGYKISQSSLMANDLGGSAKKFYGLGEGMTPKMVSDKLAVLSVSGTDVIYDPNGRFESLNVGQTAEDTFTYTIQMGNGVLSTATVKVLVQGKNDKPNGNADVYELVNRTVTDNVLNNDDDVDDGDTLTAVLATGPTKGILDLKADGSFTYAQNANAYGNDTFTYRAYDGKEYSELITVTLNGAAEPPKTTFGATIGGLAHETTWAEGSYYHETYNYTPAAEALGWYTDSYYSVPDRTIENLKGAYPTNMVWFGTQYYENKFLLQDYQYTWDTDPNGNPIGYTRNANINDNVEYIREGLLEFDVSEAFGLVSGATLNFESAYNQAFDSTKSFLNRYPPVTFDVYVYAGDNAITMDDYGAGVLAGTASLINNNRSGMWGDIQKSSISLDKDSINAILSSGSDYIGIRLASNIPDTRASEGDYSNSYSFVNNINVNTASLEFIYA